MKQYPKYKDSKISWLGDIPEHWMLKKIREHFKERKEKVSDKDFAPLSVAKIGIVPQLEDACKTDNGDNRKLVLAGDFVVNPRSDRKVSCGVSPLDGSVSLINIILTPHTINSSYIHYLFRSNDYIEEFYRNGRGIVADLWTTRYSEMRNIVIPYPTLNEQQAIVDFLDKAVVKIDRYIAAKEAEIEKLGTLKQSIISQAVTKGLDPNAPMKDSGIPWIGNIPEHWNITKAKRILQKLLRPVEYNSPVLICSNHGNVVLRGDRRIGLISATEHDYQGVMPGDLLIHGMDTWHGAIAVSNFKGKCTSVVHVCNSTQNKLFVMYYLQGLAIKKVFKAITNGVRQNTSDFRSWTEAGKIPIAVPPISEQQAIVKYIDEQVQKIGTSVGNIRQQIEKLKTYKQRLISDAVTGKIDVRPAARKA